MILLECFVSTLCSDVQSCCDTVTGSHRRLYTKIRENSFTLKPALLFLYYGKWHHMCAVCDAQVRQWREALVCKCRAPHTSNNDFKDFNPKTVLFPFIPHPSWVTINTAPKG